MKPTISAFKNSPDKGRGLARDMRVRWALEEVGQDYDVKLFTFPELKQPEYLEWQPFGQIPAYEEGDLRIWESSSIVLHLAESRSALLPKDEVARKRVITWMFSAVSTLEQPIVAREYTVLFEKEKPWFQERLPMMDAPVRMRLKSLSDYLGDREWLEADMFTAADLTMIIVLRRLETQGFLKEFPNLFDYVERGKARPAYQRAFKAQHDVFLAAGQ